MPESGTIIPEVLEVCGLKFKGCRIFIEATSDEVESQANMFYFRDTLLMTTNYPGSIFTPAWTEPKPRRTGTIKVK